MRALLALMTLHAIFFAYHLNWMQQRRYEREAYQRFVAQHEADRDFMFRMALYDHSAVTTLASDGLPPMLKLLGEPAQPCIEKNWDDRASWKAEYDRLKALFPEAVVVLNQQ